MWRNKNKEQKKQIFIQIFEETHMNKLSTIIFFILIFTYSLNAQEIAPEFYIEVENADAFTLYNFELTRISSAYCYDKDDPDEELLGCDVCGSDCDDCDGGLEYNGIYTNASGDKYGQDGYGACADGGNTRAPHFGYGVYKLTILNNGITIYIDTRDDRYNRPEGFGDYGDDFKIRWKNESSWFWRTSALPYNSTDYISDGETVNIWTIFDKSNTHVTEFPSDFWDNCLALGKQRGYCPNIMWGKHPTWSVSGYNVYSSTPSNGIATNFQLVEEASSTEYSYIDKSVDEINDDNDPYIRLYYVKAKNGSNLSDRTNVEIVFSDISWSNALVMTTDDNDNPLLFWDEYQGFTATYYKIYRASSSTPIGNPLLLNWSLIQTTNSSTFSYVDDDINITASGDYIYYQVKAYRNGVYSLATNNISTRGNFYKQNINSEGKSISRFNLFDNYPNPFNPTTTITYQLPIKGQVVLKIFNTMGEEVAVLENEFKEKGTYSATFNAENLPSGMYFYHLRTGDYSETKKMILMK